MSKKINIISGFTFLLSAVSPFIANAATWTDENTKVTFDSTVSFGSIARVAKRDKDLIGIANGGTAPSLNSDEGDLNYHRGIAATVFKATHELNIETREKFGAFARFTYLFDPYNNEKSQLVDEAKERIAHNIDLLDHFVYLNTEVAETHKLAFKFGNQAINWGESTFIRNGINNFNPVDATKIRTPGSEVRDALLPFPALNVNAGLTENLSVEGFYQFQWEKSELEARGTFFSTNNFASPGGERIYLGFGTSKSLFLRKGRPDNPSDFGQYGIALRYFSPEINNTEFALYHTRYHSRFPIVSARIGSGVPATIISSSRYFLEYPEDIKTYGGSFNTEIGSLGLAWQGEVNYRQDQPLQIHSIELIQAGLSPLSAFMGVPVAALATNQVLRDRGINTLGGINALQNTTMHGFKRYDVVTGQTTLSKVLGPNLKADQVTLVGEVGFNYVNDMPSKSKLRLDALGTFRGGNPILAGAEGVERSSAFPTAFSWGYVLATKLEYLNLFSDINVYPKLSFRHDVSGITPNPLATFRERQKAISIGFDSTWQNSWQFNVQYTNYFGAGRYHLLRDRDHISAEVKYSF
jgi:hypothetical protein